MGAKATRKPHQLNVAPGLTLEPAARLNPIEIAVDVELQQDRRMIRRPAGCLRIDPAEPKLVKIEFVDKNVDHASGIVFADPVFKPFRKQSDGGGLDPYRSEQHYMRGPRCRERQDDKDAD